MVLRFHDNNFGIQRPKLQRQARLVVGPDLQGQADRHGYGDGLLMLLIDVLEQWFSTFVSWRPTKYNKTQFGDPSITNIVLKHRFWRP